MQLKYDFTIQPAIHNYSYIYSVTAVVFTSFNIAGTPNGQLIVIYNNTIDGCKNRGFNLRVPPLL